MASDTNRLRPPMVPANLPALVGLSVRLSHLRWLATIVPAAAVFTYESVRHQAFDHYLHIEDFYGNLVTGGVALLFSFIFARAIFRSVERIQHEAVEETRTTAALNSMIEERERLSRELHDGLAQVVSYVLVRLDTVRNLVEDEKQDAAIRELESLRVQVDSVNVDVRESIAGLRSRVVERGLIEALGGYLEEYEERYGINTELRGPSAHLDISPNAALQLFRIVQEALTNVRKHAAADLVRVGITRTPTGLELVVADGGSGFDVAGTAALGRAYGLVSMRERARSLGGECRVTSSPGHGTTVTITIPSDGLQR